jgi:hypothetical protein
MGRTRCQRSLKAQPLKVEIKGFKPVTFLEGETALVGPRKCRALKGRIECPESETADGEIGGENASKPFLASQPMSNPLCDLDSNKLLMLKIQRCRKFRDCVEIVDFGGITCAC